MITDRLLHILTDSFWKILLPGIKVTIPLTVLSFSLALIIAVVVALVQFADVRGLKQLALARFYIWAIRGTPLLVQLYVIFCGEVAAIIGPSGAGKTTLLRCVNFLERASSGELIFDGQSFDLASISKRDIAAIRLRTGFVF